LTTSCIENAEEIFNKSATVAIQTKIEIPVASLSPRLTSPEPSPASSPLPVISSVSSGIERGQVIQTNIDQEYDECDVDSGTSDDEEEEADDEEEFEIKEGRESGEMGMAEPGNFILPFLLLYEMVSIN
jgi:hypothetical protein